MVHPLQLAVRFWLPLLIVVIAVGYGAHWFWNAFHDQGYAPAQPIAFSHQRHAGELKIDCQYCHFNVSKGKHAGVPPTQVCLGCHTQVATDKPEVQKLLTIAEKGSYTDEAGVVKEGGVVHWNRVHQLPDHVYFSHEWHVQGGVACQTCHGPVEEMTVMRQHSDLTMGWCLDCHRRTNYLGGRTYDERDPASFTVGTANNQAIVRKQDQDQPVVWAERQLKGRTPSAPAGEAPAGDDHAGHHHPAPAEPRTTVKTQVDELIAKHPEWRNLPRWRIADLPESHRAIYRDLYKDVPEAEQLSLFDLQRSFMNAPTQCSTCHQ